MKKILMGAVALAVVAVGTACSHKNVSSEATGAAVSADVAQAPLMGGTTAFIPKATVFKMSGAYADHVAVTLGADGSLAYYPAPTDITENSLPVYLGNGWWLNRQGLGANSVFTTWTMKEYAALPTAPTPAEIKSHIIPGAKVTEFHRTSVPATSALKELDKIKAEL